MMRVRTVRGLTVAVVVAAGLVACAFDTDRLLMARQGVGADGGGLADGGAGADGRVLTDGAVDVDGDGGDGAAPACNGVDLQTDQSHCGQCGHDCGGGACKGGVCQPFVIVPAVTGGIPMDLALDERRLYWVDDEGSVRRIDKSGQSLKLLHAFGAKPSLPAGISVAASGVYMTITSGNDIADVYFLDRDGDAVAVPKLVFHETGEYHPTGIFARTDVVYWIHETGANNGAILTSDIPVGGAVSQIFPALTTQPWALTADDRYVYWLQPYRGLMRGDIGDPGNQAIVDGCDTITYPGSLVLRDNQLYFVNTSAGGADPAGIWRVNADDTALTGCPLSRVPIATERNALGLAVTKDLVVYTVPTAGAVYATGRSGGAVRTLADGQTTPLRVVADDQAAYFARADGSIVKIAF